MSDDTHPWDAAFPEEDEQLAAPVSPEERFVAAQSHHPEALDLLLGPCEAAPVLTGFEAVDAYIHSQGFVLVAPTRPARIPKTRAPKPAQGSPVRHLDARQQELLAHMVVRDNLATFGLDEHIADWATLKKVMMTLGGTWKKGKPGGFLFPPDIDGAEVVRLAQTSGEIFDPKLVGFFPTPDALADYVVGLIDIPRGAVVLEPSAGRGALVRAVLRAQPGAEVHCHELLADNATHLRTIDAPEVNISVALVDFLTVAPGAALYDAVVMNPPFADGADVAHVTHALGFVKKGGALVAIMSAGVVFRQDRRTAAFRALVDKHRGRFVDNPEGAFLESGTGVRTVTLVIERMP